MKNKILLFIGVSGVSAEKIWNFRNYTVNVSNDLFSGGVDYGN